MRVARGREAEVHVLEVCLPGGVDLPFAQGVEIDLGDARVAVAEAVEVHDDGTSQESPRCLTLSCASVDGAEDGKV